MNESDKARFGIVINALAAGFRIEATKPLLHGYWLGLRDLSVKDLEHAAARAGSCAGLGRAEKPA